MRFSIQTKLVFSMTFVLFAMAIVGWRGIVGMNDINQVLNSINTDQFTPARQIANANIALLAWNRATLNHVLAEDTSKMDEFEQIMLEQKTTLTERLQSLPEAKNLSSREQELVLHIQNEFDSADTIRGQVVALSRTGDQEAARLLLQTELRPIVDHMDADMSEFLQLQEEQLQQAIVDTNLRFRHSLTRIAWIIGAASLSSLLIIILVTRSMTEPLKELIEGIETISLGNLEYSIDIKSNDEVGNLAIAFNNMTGKLKMAQEQLIRSEKLAVLGKLAGGVGHELRNPLGVISNAVYYLKTVLPDPDETTERYLETISRNVRKSEQIISDLLDLSRTQTGEKEPVSVLELVEEVVENQPPPEGIKISTQIPTKLPTVSIDPQQISQVLTNLITNGYQAMPEGGQLSIRAQVENSMVDLSITDTGSGISRENMDKIFEPLFTTKARGIGLGLVVSKNLVEVNRGSIRVESREGQGSTFTISLPVEEVAS